MTFCFYGNGIYQALIGKPTGGAELQVALITKSLSKDHQVIIIDTKGNEPDTKVGNISVHFTLKSNIKGLRFILEKIPNSFRYLFKAKADFYYVRGFSSLFLIVAFVAWYRKAKFILGLASDMDVLGFKKRFQYVFRVKTSLYRWLKNDLPSSIAGAILLRSADIILVQHSNQQKVLLERKIQSEIFSNIFLTVTTKQLKSIDSDCFVYVGSLNERKGLSELLTIINNCPQIKFKIIGQPYGIYAFEKIDHLRKNPNVQYLGQLPRESVIQEVLSSKGLINISKMEGFPNTFLEAWSLGKPVYSLWVDPGGVIEKHNLGKCFYGNLDTMSEFLKSFSNNIPSEPIKQYVEKNHSYEDASSRFLKAILG